MELEPGKLYRFQDEELDGCQVPGTISFIRMNLQGDPTIDSWGFPVWKEFCCTVLFLGYFPLTDKAFAALGRLNHELVRFTQDKNYCTAVCLTATGEAVGRFIILAPRPSAAASAGTVEKQTFESWLEPLEEDSSVDSR